MKPNKTPVPPTPSTILAFRIVSALYDTLTLLFGLAFPVIGVVLGALGIAPPGENPWGPALGMIIAGPCTALFYMPVAILGLIASRRLSRQEPGAENWAIACAATTLLTCAPVGAGLLILAFMGLNSADPTPQSQTD